MKSRDHQTLERPQLEYATETWNTYNVTNADRLEHIKSAAARFVHHDYRRATSVDDLINILGWDHLHPRRIVFHLAMFCKMHYRLVNIHIPQLVSSATFICKHDQQLRYGIHVATIDSSKFSYNFTWRLRCPRLWLRTISRKSTCGGSLAFPWEAQPKGGNFDGV